MTNYEQVNDSTQFSRRTFLKMLGIGGAGVAIGASGVGSMWSFKSMFNTPEDPEKDAYEFYGKVQPGITTPTQKTCNFVALDLKSKDRDAIKAMFKKWTVMADRMMDGDTVGKTSNNPLMPPVDTGESIGLGASKLTITLDTAKVSHAWTTFKSNIDHVDKKSDTSANDQYHVSQLNDALEKAIKAIDDNQLSDADAALTHFIEIWPYVEGQIQTKDGALYTKIEDKIPYYQSVLDEHNKSHVKDGLVDINNQIKEVVGHSYSFVDVMIIFLREGLEVLLIVMTLTTMTRKVKDNKGTASVIGGAIAGLVLSIILAITFVETLGNSGILRESMEAGLGIVAVILMFIVGVWMHKRSNAKRWNDMIKNMYANAISNGNLVLLATIGLISVLREGVEVIIFYMGMIGELATKDFIIGIALAIVILIVFAVLFRFIVRLIPIFYIFRVLSIFIFIMGFKMLGVSIQKLQLLGAMPRHVIEGFPTINWLGFYPSYEPLIAQAAYIMVVAILIFKFKK
ncbi:Dyp-type peroxidase domain-containing protein [Staphylococcus aureus]|uniref:Dyp-type peroxidase domain-containing protein n=14 Tax=Bacillota TaxID=1239 RepID=UPI00387A7712